MDAKTVHEDSSYEKELLKEHDAKSITSSISNADTAVTPSSFNPTDSLFINAHGIRLIRLPVPPSELEIAIHRPDGSVAYISQREKRCSGNTTLLSPEAGELLKTSYFFGPNRDPIIQSASKATKLVTEQASVPEIKVTGKWNSRAQFFTTLYGDLFQWRYVRCDDPRWDCKKLIVLEKMDKNNPNTVERRVAQLVRNDSTRPQGTSKSTAGNGGELVMDRDAMGTDIDEALVVATCLLMLKKEIDRRRLLQAMVLSGMVSGGP